MSCFQWLSIDQRCRQKFEKGIHVVYPPYPHTTRVSKSELEHEARL